MQAKLPPAKIVMQHNASGIILTSHPHPSLNTTKTLDEARIACTHVI